MSSKLLVICHCECNEVEQSNHKAFGIASRSYPAGTPRAVRNDNYLTGHDINYPNKLNEPQRHREHGEKRNRESFCVSFGTFFYLEDP